MDQRLRALYDKGMSFALIAADFGGFITRNSAIGRAHRLGICGRGRGNHPLIEREHRLNRKKAEPRPRGAPKPRIRLVPVNGHHNAKLRILESITTEPIAVRCAAIVPRNLSLIDLEPNDCRYPYGGDDGTPTVFCGHGKLEGSSYCPDHFRLSVGRGTASERAAGRVYMEAAE
jgi:GcrA cell cycle regulator